MDDASEMVERVARAMEPGAFATFERGYTCANAIEERAFLNAEKVVKRARRKARAAIEAMRSPTNYMSVAGWKRADEFGAVIGNGAVAAVFDAMIDEALSPSSAP